MKLHLGGEQIKDGWKIFNIEKKTGVDFVGNILNLEDTFSPESCEEIYASHVIEHIPFLLLEKVINSIFALLKKGGKFYISVPDLEIIAKIFLQEVDEVYKIQWMRIIYGGQLNKYDFHYVGLYESLLFKLLRKADFTYIKRVDLLNIFNDTSSFRIREQLISLNVIATK